MINFSKLTDVELAVLTYAVEVEVDGLDEDGWSQEYIDAGDDLRERLEWEYERRGLDSSRWERHG